MATVKEHDDLVDECLKEMFKRVGEKYPNKKLTDKVDWYRQRTWNTVEEKSYELWLKKRLKKAYPHLTERKLKMEVGVFLLMWGWRIKD